MINFRDMSDTKISNKDGKKLKKNLLFRSGHLIDMTKEDIENFKALGIKTIFDYRDVGEATRKPDPVIENVSNIICPANPDKDSEVPTLSFEDFLMPKNLEKTNRNYMIDLYAKLPINNPSYHKLISLMGDEHLGLLHHCSFGKDRTGVGGAIMLMILNYSDNEAMTDYLLSNEFLDEDNLKIIDIASPNLDDEHLEMLKDSIYVHDFYLEKALESIYKHYNTFDEYILKEFNIDDKKRSDLCDLFLY